MLKTKITKKLLLTLPLLIMGALPSRGKLGFMSEDVKPEGYQPKKGVTYVSTSTYLEIPTSSRSPTPLEEAILRKDSGAIQTLIEEKGKDLEFDPYCMRALSATNDKEFCLLTFKQLNVPYTNAITSIIRFAHSSGLYLLPDLYKEAKKKEIEISEDLWKFANKDCLPGIKVLVEEVGAKDIRGMALVSAIQKGNREMVDYIIKNAIETPQPYNFEGKWALQEAIKRRDPYILLALLNGVVAAKDYVNEVLPRAMTISKDDAEIVGILREYEKK